MYPEEFKPKATDDLVRIGAQLDGGYVIPERMLGATRGILSFGLSDEWEFEQEFTDRKDVRVVCFDHSVTGAFWLKKMIANTARGLMRLDMKKFRRAFRYFDYLKYFDGKPHKHIRKALGYSANNVVSLQEALETSGLDDEIFLKMDIEGWEYRLLFDLVLQQNRFVGMAIEFHDVDLHEERIVKFIKDISDMFTLVHFHANSHTTVGPGGKALVVEMSFMNKKLLQDDEVLKYRDLPIAGLDAPNLPGDREAVVEFRAEC